jgi:hypothetical protein
MGKVVDKCKKAYSSIKNGFEKKVSTYFKKKTITIPSIKNNVVPEQEGLTYIAINECIPFQLKCGEHHKSFNIENRMKALSSTSVSENFKPICVVKSKHCTEIEKKIHEKFFKYRINPRREFFGFKLGLTMSSSDFEHVKEKYEKLLRRMVKKMHKYAVEYGGEIISCD